MVWEATVCEKPFKSTAAEASSGGLDSGAEAVDAGMSTSVALVTAPAVK